MFIENSINSFIEELSSKNAVPGGGSASALSSSIGASLIIMVTNLTIGRKKYLEVSDKMQEVQDKVIANRDTLTKLIEEDSKGYSAVMDAFKLPKETEEEKKARSKAIQEALVVAANVPLEIARVSLDTLKYVPYVFKNGNSNAVSDAKVAAVMLRSGTFGAIYNVEINVDSLKDRELAEKYTEEIAKIREEAIALEKEVIND